MINNEQLVKDLTAKDEQKALLAAKNIINNKNIEAFKILANKTEFLFDFVKNNVAKRLSRAINEQNYRNIFEFLTIYIPEYEDALVGALANFANEDLTDEILNLLENGNDAQKTYSAKYFSYIPDTISTDLLIQYALDDNENESLAFNSAKALGVMQTEAAYDKAIELLKSDDEFTVLKAVKFLVAYENKNAIEDLLKAMQNSSMAENIAGEIPYLESLLTIVKTKSSLALLCIENIVAGLGEILPLNQIFNFEMYEVLSYLISDNQQNKNSQVSVVLLSALSKFEILANNDEYTFDEDKNTKQEIAEIYNLLKQQQEYFWNAQKKLAIQELSTEKNRISSALQVISDFKIQEARENLKELLNSNNEILICEALATLKQLGSISDVNKNQIIEKITDENQKALIESLFI